MATGDQADFTGRLLRLLPKGWFPSAAPVLQSVLQGPAMALAAIYAMLAFVKAQTRIQTSQGAFLDMAAADYFGVNGLPRLAYEQDAAYADRIEFNLTAPRGTREGMIGMLQQLTGTAPVIFCPTNPGDTGGLATPGNWGNGTSVFALAGVGSAGAGGLGSLAMPAQTLITVTLPSTGLAVYAGYSGLATPANFSAGGGGGLATPTNFDAGAGNFGLADLGDVPGLVDAALIYKQVDEWTAAGCISWVKII
jgi:hypothetical protein